MSSEFFRFAASLPVRFDGGDRRIAISLAVAGDLSDFKSPLDNSPIEFQLQPGEIETPA